MRSSAKSQAIPTGTSTAQRKSLEGAEETDAAEATDDVPRFSPLRADREEKVVAGGGQTGEGGQGQADAPDLDEMAVEDEAMELISGSVRRQVEAEVFVPVMGR